MHIPLLTKTDTLYMRLWFLLKHIMCSSVENNNGIACGYVGKVQTRKTETLAGVSRVMLAVC